MREANIKGMSVGLLVDGQLVYAKGFGFADHAGTILEVARLQRIANMRRVLGWKNKWARCGGIGGPSRQQI
jgi:hypothetical protein